MKALQIAVFAFLVVLVAGCEITIRGDLNWFILESAEYRAGYSYNGSSVVCDDRATDLEISLAYYGRVEHVTASLVGGNSGWDRQLSSFSPSASENETGSIRRTFNVPRGFSPLGSIVPSQGAEVFGEEGGSLSAQSIVVVPKNPTVIGYTRLVLKIQTSNGENILHSQQIPVLNHCFR